MQRANNEQTNSAQLFDLEAERSRLADQVASLRYRSKALFDPEARAELADAVEALRSCEIALADALSRTRSSRVFLCDGIRQKQTEGDMRRQAETDDDDFEISPSGVRVLKDGRRLKVSMFARDGAPNPFLTDRQRAIAAAQIADARAEHDDYLRNAWRTDARRIEPEPDDDDDEPPEPPRRRKVVQRDPFGREISSFESDAQPTLDELQLEHAAAVEVAYADYDRELLSAWRK